MTPSIHSERSSIFCDHIRELRSKAGLTQRDLATALGRPRGMVARIEIGERRVDAIELFEILTALQADPVKEAGELMRKFADVA